MGVLLLATAAACFPLLGAAPPGLWPARTALILLAGLGCALIVLQPPLPIQVRVSPWFLLLALSCWPAWSCTGPFCRVVIQWWATCFSVRPDTSRWHPGSALNLPRASSVSHSEAECEGGRQHPTMALTHSSCESNLPCLLLESKHEVVGT